MISEEVRELRISMGMTRRKFCEYFNIPYRTMTDWEAGKRKMPEYLFKLMEYKAEAEKLVETNKNIGEDFMIATEYVTIKIPAGMSKYLKIEDPETELVRNALLLYPYILNQTISHGRAAEILGIRKSELIGLYDKLGYSYLDMTMDDLDAELNTYRELKKKEAAV